MSDWNRWPPRPWEAATPRRQFAIFTAITGYVASALVGIGLSAAVAGVAANLLVGAALLGLSMLLSPKPPVMKTPQAQAVLNQSIGPRIRGYGRALLGGTRAFFDSRNGYLYQAVMMHSGRIDAIESIRIGDKTVSLNSSGEVTNDEFTWTVRRSGGVIPGGGTVETRYAITLRQFLGTTTQTPGTLIQGAFPQAWTDDHRLLGIAYIAARFRSPPQEDFQKIFPEGYNTPVRGLCRLSRVWDPRTDETAWSDNSGLCILDYLTHPDGFRKSRDDIDLDSFRAFADLCDEDVPRKGGGTEKRYRLWGVYQLTDEPEDILRKMRATCDAELYQNADGKIAIRGGKWEPPNVVITDRDILGHNLEQGNDRFAAFNELRISYTSPEHDYQSIEATPWIDLPDQDERGPLPAELDLDFVPSPAQARRLAKIHIAKANPRWKGTISTNLLGLDALGERTVQVVLPELEIDTAFYVASYSIDPELKGVEIGIMTISEAAYTWDAETEEGENPPIPEETSPDLTYPVPQGLALSSPVPGRVEAEVEPIDREELELQVQIRAGAGSLWQEMEVGDDNASAVFEPASPALYQARARWVGPLSTTGEWSFPYAVIDTTVPVPSPLDLMADVEGETVHVSWTNPNFAQFFAARVYRVVAGQPFDPDAQISLQYGAPSAGLFFDDTPGAGSWDYYVTAEDSNGNRSLPAGPATVELT